MRCIAIDDEPLALKLLTHYCSRIPSLRLLGAYTDPLDGIEYIRSMQPDLIFLDIRMPEFSGVHIVRALEKDTLVIFTTAHREYAVEGFNLDVVDYLLKPFDFERFLKAYEKAEQRFRSLSRPTLVPPQQAASGKTVSIKYNYRNIPLPHHTILYIEACDNYIRIVTPDKVYMPVMTMKTILSLLPETEFARVHKSFAVAVHKIRSFNSARILIDCKEIPVGRNYRRDFLQKMGAIKRES
jgi:DNA-binding LytR/AlgR family response regulator